MLVKIVSVEDGAVAYSARVPLSIWVPVPLVGTRLIPNVNPQHSRPVRNQPMKVTTIRCDVPGESVFVVSLQQVNGGTWLKVPRPLIQDELPVFNVFTEDVSTGGVFRIGGNLKGIEKVA